MLQNMTLRGKIFIAASIVGFCVSAVLGVLMYVVSVKPVETKVSQSIIAEMQTFIDSQIEQKIQSGIMASTALSIQHQVSEALEVEEREELTSAFSEIQQQYRKQTEHKHIDTQLITADGRSLIKSWDIDSYGQNLTNSPLIQRAMKDKHAFGSLAIGGRGAAVVAISPVFNEGEFYGMVSMIQGLSSIRKSFLDHKNGEWILLLNQKYINDKYGSMPILEKNTSFTENHFVANDEWFPKDVLHFAKQSYIETMGKATNVYLEGGKVIIDLPAFDESNKVLGRHLFILDEQTFNQPIEEALISAEISLVGILLGILVLTLSLVLIFNVIVINPLRRMRTTTANILDTGDFKIRCPVKGKDEISETSESFNSLLENISQALNEANETVKALSQGDFEKRMVGAYEGDLRSLKEGINKSTNVMDTVMNQISKIITALRDSDYDVSIISHAKGRYKQILFDAQAAIKTSKNVVREINDVMDNMQHGRFNSRVEIEAKGEFAILKSHINDSMDTLNNAISDIKTVITAQSEGDLTQQIQNHYDGELFILKEAINLSIEKLSKGISKATDSAFIVQSEANKLSDGADDLNGRLQQQAAAVEETSATMAEMNAAVENNTDSAQCANTVVSQVQSDVSQAGQVMEKTIDAMNSIQKSSHEIAEIVTLIDSIAFQTNLLALNAAVEAARAGEHGRGFAVVAGEVRGLAQKSANAAKDIKSLIDLSVDRIDQGTALASESGTVIKEVTKSIDEVTEMIRHINTASSEQAQGVGQVHHAITDIDLATQHNAALVERTSHSVFELNAQANDLSETMSFFKTNHLSSIQAASPVKEVGKKADKKTKVIDNDTSNETPEKKLELTPKNRSEADQNAPLADKEVDSKKTKPTSSENSDKDEAQSQIQTYKKTSAETKLESSEQDEWADF